MRQTARLFRLTAGVALSALLWDAVSPLAAVAQTALPPLPGAAQPAEQNVPDPPERVGRIAAIKGAVSFHNQGDTQWSPASVNYPVSSGNSFWTDAAATAELEISDSRVALAGGTELSVQTLDASGMQAVLMQGEAYLHLHDLQPNEAWTIVTPRGTVRLAAEGRYDIVVGSTEQPTLVTVVEGSAQVEAPGVSLSIPANQTATITGANPFTGSAGPTVRSAFLTAQLEAERPRPAPAAVVPQQVYAMPGGQDLAATGSWSAAPDYGQVWYPPVQQGWVPYREGHWAYVAPWGWTWVDSAPWGFAPFHYGRWVELGGRWAWTPGVVQVAAPPVYAPALVSFIGLAAGVAVGAALVSGSIGWVPLGPREPYHPWYHASPAYVRQVNVRHVTNINTVNIENRNVTINNYINRGAATSIPAAAMVASRPVAAIARPVTAQQFAAARPIVGLQPLRPTAATAGVTPVVARQMNLGQIPAARIAPGPALRVQAQNVPTVPAGGRPPLPNVGSGTRPGVPEVPNFPGARPGVPAGVVRPAGTPSEAARPTGAAPRSAGTAAAVGQVHPVGPEPRPANVPVRPVAPPPPAAQRPAVAPRPQPAPHFDAAPRREAAPRPVMAPRPGPAPHPVAAMPPPHPTAPPRPVPVAAPQPRPAPAPRPPGHEKRPGEP